MRGRAPSTSPESPMNSSASVEQGCSKLWGTLVIIVAVAILAFVGLSGFRGGGDVESAARNRTISAHGAIQAALEKYKEKFGAYPEPANPKEEDRFAGIPLASGAAHMLYQAITADGNSAIVLKSAASGGASESDGKVSDEEVQFMLTVSPLPKSMIYPPNLPVGTVKPRLLVDGWARPFQYTKGDPDPTKNKAMNPTYDLWSVGPNPAPLPPSDSLATKRDEKITGSWIKNW